MNKGLSQVLSVIIAASVLVTTAAILMFLVGDSLPSSANDVEVSSCQTVIQTQCSGSSDMVQAPSACTTDEGTVPQSVSNQVRGLSTSGNLDCSEYE